MAKKSGRKTRKTIPTPKSITDTPKSVTDTSAATPPVSAPSNAKPAASVPATRKSTELVVSPQQAAREIVRNSLREIALAPGFKLGISTKRLGAYIVAHRLEIEQAKQILALRQEHNAGIPAVMRLYAQGLSLDTISSLYDARAEMDTFTGENEGISLTLLYKFAQAFGLSDEEELDPAHLAEVVKGCHEELSEASGFDFWYVSDTAQFLIRAREHARKHGSLVDIAGALKMVKLKAASGASHSDDAEDGDL